MDLSTITDINQLKAMAYDEIATIQSSQANLDKINARILEVSSTIIPSESPNDD